jgi:hypothetical protein
MCPVDRALQLLTAGPQAGDQEPRRLLGAARDQLVVGTMMLKQPTPNLACRGLSLPDATLLATARRRRAGTRRCRRSRRRSVPGWQHHPEPGPGQPAAEQLRAPATDPRALPQSHCSHIPGSGIHGRYVRRRPGLPGCLRLCHGPASGPLRAVVPHRSQPAVHPSARILPLLRSTSSSTLAANSSMLRGRRGRAAGSAPASPTTYRAAVLRSLPASCAAECAQPVRSDASRISMASLPDLVTVPPGRWARNSGCLRSAGCAMVAAPSCCTRSSTRGLRTESVPGNSGPKGRIRCQPVIRAVQPGC